MKIVENCFLAEQCGTSWRKMDKSIYRIESTIIAHDLNCGRWKYPIYPAANHFKGFKPP